MYDSGERVRVHRDGVSELATVRAAVPSGDTSGWTLFLLDDDGSIHEIELTADDTHTVTKIQTDGAADSARVLAGMWTRWMGAAATNAESSAIASTQLRPYAHQTTAAYGAMLPQPLLRLRGDRMGGLVKYLFGPGRAEEHTNQRIVAASDSTWLGTVAPDSQTLAQLISEMDGPVTTYGDTTNAGYVYHLVVSLPATDGQLSHARWQQAAQRFADKLGFDEQVHWIAINHGTSTNGNDHIHFVATLIRAEDGRVHELAFDRMRRREARIELEEEFGLTATSPAGLGETRSLSRREVEQVRSGAVASVSDLGQHRVATLVRAVASGARSEAEFVERLRGAGLIVRGRQERDRPGVITGYSVAGPG